MSLRNLNRIKRLELGRNLISVEDQRFLELYRNTESPPHEMQMKAFLIELKSTSLEELILEANINEEFPDEQAQTG